MHVRFLSQLLSLQFKPWRIWDLPNTTDTSKAFKEETERPLHNSWKKSPFPDNTEVRPLQTQTLSPQGSLWFRQTCISIDVCVCVCVSLNGVLCALLRDLGRYPPLTRALNLALKLMAFSLLAPHIQYAKTFPPLPLTVLQVSCWISR